MFNVHYPSLPFVFFKNTKVVPHAQYSYINMVLPYPDAKGRCFATALVPLG